MTIDQAIYILKNTAWLGSNDKRDETECAVETVINELERRRWILCSERLPEEYENVLTTISIPGREPKVRSGYYCREFFNNDNGDCWNSYDPEVAAWMSQPEPYGGEQE